MENVHKVKDFRSHTPPSELYPIASTFASANGRVLNCEHTIIEMSFKNKEPQEEN